MMFLNYCKCKEGGLSPTRLYGEQKSEDSCEVKSYELDKSPSENVYLVAGRKWPRQLR
jgi:hypothetical protein